MILGALILVDSPMPEARIRLSTALAVTVPLAVITVVLLRLAIAAQRRKSVAGTDGMVDSVGVVKSEINPTGQVLVRGEFWQARASSPIAPGTRVRVVKLDGLTLIVEPVSESR